MPSPSSTRSIVPRGLAGRRVARVSIPVPLWAAVGHVLQNSLVTPAENVRRGPKAGAKAPSDVLLRSR